MPMTNAQYKALKHIRRNRQGLYLEWDIVDRIATIREQYETEPSNEATRLLLEAYKKMHFVLFIEDIK